MERGSMTSLVFNPVMPDWSVAQTLVADAVLIAVCMAVLFAADRWWR